MEERVVEELLIFVISLVEFQRRIFEYMQIEKEIKGEELKILNINYYFKKFGYERNKVDVV